MHSAEGEGLPGVMLAVLRHNVGTMSSWCTPTFKCREHNHVIFPTITAPGKTQSFFCFAGSQPQGAAQAETSDSTLMQLSHKGWVTFVPVTALVPSRLILTCGKCQEEAREAEEWELHRGAAIFRTVLLTLCAECLSPPLLITVHVSLLAVCRKLSNKLRCYGIQCSC